MDKALKIIFTIISFIMVLQFILIFILFNRNFPTQDISSISSERVKEVALNYINRGTAGDVTLVNNECGRIYAVDITYEDINYVIYVHGETGDVLWLTREEVR